MSKKKDSALIMLEKQMKATPNKEDLNIIKQIRIQSFNMMLKYADLYSIQTSLSEATVQLNIAEKELQKFLRLVEACGGDESSISK